MLCQIWSYSFRGIYPLRPTRDFRLPYFRLMSKDAKTNILRSREGLLYVWAVAGLYIKDPNSKLMQVLKKWEIHLEFWIVGVASALYYIFGKWCTCYLHPKILGSPLRILTPEGEREMTPTRGSREWETLHLGRIPMILGQMLLPPIEGDLSNPNLLSHMSSSSISFKADHLTYINTKCLHSYSRRQLEALCTW